MRQPLTSADGRVRVGEDGPSVRIGLPRHAVSATGSDSLDWVGTTTTDGDEVETEYVSGPLRAVVQRYVSGGTWRLRASIANIGLDAVSTSLAEVEVEPGDGQAWVWAAGSAGMVAVHDDEAGLWALALRRGTLTCDDDAVVWLHAGTTVEPGRRVTVELSGRRCRSWDDAASMLPAWLPPLAVRGDEPVDLALPDAGVHAPGCAIAEVPDGTEIRGSGVQRVSVRGAFGEVDLDLAFAPTMAEAVESAARQVGQLLPEATDNPDSISWRRPVPGSADLERTARRLLVVQAAHIDEAADVLGDLLVSGVADLGRTRSTSGPFTLAALAGEVQRRDDPEDLAALLDALAGVESRPGLVLALTRVWAALWSLGRDPEPVREALARVTGESAPTIMEDVEQSLIRGDRDAMSRLLAALGGGLPGEPVPPRSPAETAYAVALASLVPDEDQEGAALVHAAELVARRLTAQHGDDPDVLAWLLLGER